MPKEITKKCNVRWDEPCTYQDKELFFENKEQFKRFMQMHRQVLQFLSRAVRLHKDGTVTMVF